MMTMMMMIMSTWGQRAAGVQLKPDGQSSITGGLDSDNADKGHERPGRDGDDFEVGEVDEDEVGEVGEVGGGGGVRMTGGELGKLCLMLFDCDIWPWWWSWQN